MTIKNKPREIKLRAFKIENIDINKKNSGLLPILSKRLEKSKAKERIMILNQDDPKKEEDLISDYQTKNDLHLSGAMLRIMESSETPSIPDNLFDETKFVISELDKLEIGNSKIYKDHYYFLLNNNYIITNLSGGYTITRFQTYINWLLENERGDNLFEFTPLIVVRDDITVSELRNIKITDPISKHPQTPNEVGAKKIFDLSKDLIFNLFKDVKSFQDIALEKVISAELLIKFTKSKDISKEEYQRILGAYMKPIGDIENVTFVPKNGKPIKSSEILRVKSVNIDLTESNKLSEPQLLQEMEKYLNEIKAIYEK
jgi:hypothetical protein